MAVATSIMIAIAVVVSAASAAYSAYSANNNAINAKKNAERQRTLQNNQFAEQKRQEEERASITSENEATRLRAARATQRASLAASGADLNDPNSSVTALDADLTNDSTRNQSLIWQQSAWNTTNIDSNQALANQRIDSFKDSLPSTGAIAGSSALSFAGKALDTYSTYKKGVDYSNLLDRQHGTVESNNMFTGNTTATKANLGVSSLR
jgi:Tfp pilus assembly protein PilE